MTIPPAFPSLALVTGAARRIGRAVALDLAQAGFDLALHYQASEAEVERLAQDIRRLGRRAEIFRADLAQEDQVQTLMPRVVSALGPVGVLINNASTFDRDEIETASRASWDFHMEVNLRAPFVLIQAMHAALPADRQGLVVNLLDQRVWNLTPHFTTYTLSKAGLWTLTQTLALALAPRIRVVGIGPGPALPSVRQSQDQFDAQCAATPLGVGTSPEQIAGAVRFALAQPALTGQMIALDGGQHLNWCPGRPNPEE